MALSCSPAAQPCSAADNQPTGRRAGVESDREIIQAIPAGARELPARLRQPSLLLEAIAYWAGDCGMLGVLAASGVNLGLGASAIVLHRFVSFGIQVAAGAIAVSTKHTRRLISALVLSAAISALIALPLLPERELQGSVVIALNPAQGEMVGWPRFVRSQSRVCGTGFPSTSAATPPSSRANYGEAGAIDLLGSAVGLPRAYSGHNGFSEWGIPPAGATRALVVGFSSAADAAPHFHQCRTLASVNDGVGLNNNEQGLAIMLCSPSAPWLALWPRLRHYD